MPSVCLQCSTPYAINNPYTRNSQYHICYQGGGMYPEGQVRGALCTQPGFWVHLVLCPRSSVWPDHTAQLGWRLAMDLAPILPRHWKLHPQGFSSMPFSSHTPQSCPCLQTPFLPTPSVLLPKLCHDPQASIFSPKLSLFCQPLSSIPEIQAVLFRSILFISWTRLCHSLPPVTCAGCYNPAVLAHVPFQHSLPFM